MPSPFPGMDPYLEAPAIWPDFHDALAAQLRAALNHTLPAPYYARLEMRSEVGIVEDGGARHRIVSGVAVARSPALMPPQQSVAVLPPPQAAASKPVTVTVRSDPARICRNPRPQPGSPTHHTHRDRQPIQQTDWHRPPRLLAEAARSVGQQRQSHRTRPAAVGRSAVAVSRSG